MGNKSAKKDVLVNEHEATAKKKILRSKSVSNSARSELIINKFIRKISTKICSLDSTDKGKNNESRLSEAGKIVSICVVSKSF